MKRIVKLNERDLSRIVRRVINEESKDSGIPNCGQGKIRNAKIAMSEDNNLSVTVQTGSAAGAPCTDCLVITYADTKCACKKSQFFV